MRLLLTLTLLAPGAALFRHRYAEPSAEPSPGASSPGAAAYVTPLLPDQFAKAQEITKVEIAGWAGEMHSGFITIDAASNSNTFFAYSKATSKRADAPLLLWLQGGPGASSLFGMFTEIGPFNIDKEMNVAPRAVHWNVDYDLLFLDNPLGTGFSYTDRLEAMATNQSTVGDDLYEALDQFFQAFPELRARDFYVTGESYAGKYVPACAHAIHQRNRWAVAGRRINLKGISIGDGAFDPAGQLSGGFGELLYNLGMASAAERAVFREYEATIQARLQEGRPREAFAAFDEMLNGDIYPWPTYYANVTGEWPRTPRLPHGARGGHAHPGALT